MVEDLVQIVETAKSVPMSASCVINRPDVLDMLHQLRADLAEELEESRRLTTERDEVIAQARRDAEEHLEQARRERGSMLSGTEMGREAERIRNEALREAQRIREDADAYVDDKLANFEVVLSKTLQAVGRGRAKMGGRDPMDDLGQHVAEQDAVTAASRADYEYDDRDHQFDERQFDDRDHQPAPAYYDAYQDQQPAYADQQPAYAEQQPVYAEQHAAYAEPQSTYALPEPDFSHELSAADMSGIFTRPDYSQPPAPQPVGHAPSYGYENNDPGSYGTYADSASQHQSYPIQPYGSQYGTQPEYHTGEYPAYASGDNGYGAEEQHYGQQPPALPAQGQHQTQDATGFFDTGVIDVRQFRDDPYQR
jgi:hypothetical protein